MRITAGLDYILEQFEEPIFPRKIMTKRLEYQKKVSSKSEALTYFQQSKFLDCRINAYPCLTDYKDVPRYKPSLLFIDLDKNSFDIERKFQNALDNTLRNIKEKLEGAPIVVETGGGYHIYQPVYCKTALENVIEFNGFDRPSEQFLRFAKDYLSNSKADKNNNPSFKSCLLRIPGSINSKYNTKVKIVKKWNGYRPPITTDLLIEFRRYLIQKKIDRQKQRQKILSIRNNNYDPKYYPWIEHLIQTQIQDFRKLVIDIVLSSLSYQHKKIVF